jgi:hypothetical protein
MPDEPGPILAMIALNSPRMPSGSTILATFKKLCPDCPEAMLGEGDGATITLDLDGGMAFVSLMPAPIPWSELEGPCATAWWWPEAAERMKAHTHHAVVALMGEAGDAVERHVLLSHLVSAVAMHADAAGIYWGAGTIVHDPDAFQEQVANLSPNDVEPQLWIDMRLEQNDDGSFRYFTTGLTSFDRPEIEIDRSSQNPQEILEFCHAIVCYLLNNRVDIAEGETIGRSDDEKIRITYEPSMFERDGNVMKLAYT